MLSFMRKYWLYMAGGAIVLFLVPVGYSLSANRQVAYAPCLVKVLTALQNDPASAKFAKLYAVPAAPTVQPCDSAAETARVANRAIGDLLVTDRTLFKRLPAMLKASGMSCMSNELSIACDCKSGGPFVIANPGAYCTSVASVALPFTRALTVNVDIHPATRRGKKAGPGRYVVEMSYDSGFVEIGATHPHEAPKGSLSMIAEWMAD